MKRIDIMEKKKGFSVLKALIIVICIIFIALSLVINVAFSGGKTPAIFGNYFYIVRDTDAQMGESFINGAAIIAKDCSDTDLVTGDVVICYPDGSDILQLRSIYNIEQDETTGDNKYYTATAASQGTELSISKDRIEAICTGRPQSAELGSFISFTTSIKGIIALLVLPCVLLVIFLIFKIAASKEEDDEDEYDFYDYDENSQSEEPQIHSHEKQSSPLFEASQEIQPSNEFERKKMSIAENFSQKRVDHNSTYQKEKERTMQFKAQRSAETSFAARNVASQSSTAPTADALREEMLRKTAEAERTGTFSTKACSDTQSISRQQYQEPIDNTGILSKAQLAEMARNDVPKTTPLKSPAASAAPKKSSSPNIDDILEKTEMNQKKKSISAMSVDDLLKIIEDEKKKL